MRYVRFVALLVAALAAVSCTSATRTDPQQLPSVDPQPTYPNGLNAAVGEPKWRYWVSFNVLEGGGWKFDDPELARDKLPHSFIEDMNAAAGYEQFLLADGPSNFYFNLTFRKDPTGNHYGVDVQAWGLPPGAYKHVHAANETFAYQASYLWFAFSVPQSYLTAESANEAAAKQAAQYLINGWTH